MTSAIYSDSDGASAPAAARTQHARAWTSLAILFGMVTLSYVDRMAIVLMVEPIKRDLGIGDLQISYLQGLAFALCFALAGPPLAWLADRYSRHHVIFGGVAIWSLATMASGLTMDYTHLLVARFLVGIGEAALMPAAFSLLADLFPRHRHALAFGILASGGAVGGAFAVGVGGEVIRTFEALGGVDLPIVGWVRPWQMLFLLAGAPGVFAAALVYLVPRTGAPAVPGAQAAPDTRLLGWARRNWFFSLCFTLTVSLLCALAYAITNWTPSFFIRTYGLRIEDFSSNLALIQLVAGLTGYIGGGYITDRLAQGSARNAPYAYLLGVAAALLVAGIGAFGLRAGLGPSLAFLALFHLVLPYSGIVAAELHLAAPRALRSQVIASVTAVYTLVGMIVGPSSVAWLTDKVFVDPLHLGIALTIVTLVYCPVTIGLLLVSRRAAARAIAAAGNDA